MGSKVSVTTLLFPSKPVQCEHAVSQDSKTSKLILKGRFFLEDVYEIISFFDNVIFRQ